VRLLVTGGAGFVGSSIALAMTERRPDWEVVASDNLFRRGSELNLPRLRDAGVEFVHADIRDRDDLKRAGRFDALVECSAEPSVMAQYGGEADFVLQTNFVGAHHCLSLAVLHGAFVVFLSTSRVYPVATLESLRYREATTRFELLDDQPVPGASSRGVSEAVPLSGSRTLYGMSKLAAEMLIEEYAAASGLRAVVNRCGVVAGPWQMGKVDQGVFTYWALAHHFGRPLSYIGYGGAGKQVRDLLHVADLVDLVELQLGHPDHWAGKTFNVGGGIGASLSLAETTDLCRELTGNSVPIDRVPETRPGDVPVYLSDCTSLFRHTDWRPKRDARTVLADTCAWIRDHEGSVRHAIE
jgi:CDP-paratose 2-epimerase